MLKLSPFIVFNNCQVFCFCTIGTSKFKINPAIISNNPTIRSVILISDKGKGDPVEL